MNEQIVIEAIKRISKEKKDSNKIPYYTLDIELKYETKTQLSNKVLIETLNKLYFERKISIGDTINHKYISLR